MSAALNRKLTQAHERLQAGDVEGAQSICRDVLQRAPRNPDALTLLAISLLMTGRAREAVVPLEQALTAEPRHRVALENLGLAHLMLGDFAGAQRSLSSAAAIPGAPASVFMRLGIALLNQGQNTAAIEALERALKLDAANPDIHVNLGQVADRMNDTARARGHFEAALKLAPDYAEAMFNLGVVCMKENGFEAARDWFKRILARDPRHADALVNLALVAQQQHHPDEAILLLRQAVESNPASVLARINLGNSLSSAGLFDEARTHYLAALRISNGSAEAHEGIALLYTSLGRFKEAVAHLREAVKIDGNRVPLLASLADALFESGALDEAATHARRAIGLDPTLSGPYATLADIQAVRGEFDLVVETLKTGADRTGAIALLGKLTFQLRRLCDWDGWRTAWQKLEAELPGTREVVSPFSLLCEPLTAAEQLAYASRLPGQLTPHAGTERLPASTRPRLRVGYFSSDYYENAVAYLVAQVFELHDRERFEVFAYSYGPDDGSAMRTRISAACEHFIDVAREADDVVAARIRADELDILVDLKGYTMGARPGILARRPCAIQINWLGYPGTMGAEFIDYLIADPFIIPPGHESGYSERVLRMPHCYQPNDRKRPIAAAHDRAHYGLPQQGFVFCSFNQGFKITPEVFACWMRLLRATQYSVLWLLEENRWTSENLKQAAQAAGIDPARIIFAPKVPLAEHLARYRAADLALDTFPYGSHTTGSDALWSGCLLLALCGDTFASRVSGSLLNACNLPELVTHSLDDYESLALKITNDSAFRSTLGERLAGCRENAPLFDSTAFTRNLEKLYFGLVMHSDRG